MKVVEDPVSVAAVPSATAGPLGNEPLTLPGIQGPRVRSSASVRSNVWSWAPSGSDLSSRQ